MCILKWVAHSQRNTQNFAKQKKICYNTICFIGEVSEWSNETVLKTVEPRGSVGSNPTLSESKPVRRLLTRDSIYTYIHVRFSRS